MPSKDGWNDPPYDGKYGVKVTYANESITHFWFTTRRKRDAAYRKYLIRVKDTASRVKSVNRVERKLS